MIAADCRKWGPAVQGSPGSGEVPEVNSDLPFYVRIGLNPVNKTIVLHENQSTRELKSLLLDPWFFELPGFRDLFETHIFAPKDLWRTFGGTGYRLLSRHCLEQNTAAFFDEANNPKLREMDRRDPQGSRNKPEDIWRKNEFVSYFITLDRDEVHLDEVEKNLYAPIAQGFWLNKHNCVKEYRFQQFLRYLVGLRYLGLHTGTRVDPKFLIKILEYMASEVKPKRLAKRPLHLVS